MHCRTGVADTTPFPLSCLDDGCNGFRFRAVSEDDQCGGVCDKSWYCVNCYTLVPGCFHYQERANNNPVYTVRSTGSGSSF